jgi:hypothetical protein
MSREPSLPRIAAPPMRGALGSGRRLSVGHALRATVLVGAPLLLIGVLAWPMLFTNEGFNEDWVHHLWFMWNQSVALSHDHQPSFFLNYSHSVFYPEFAYYGGTLYAMLGGLSLALGGAPLETYVFSYLLGFATGYGGWYWIARMARLGRWWAHLPAVIFITSSYYLTLVYARGDLQEFLAVSIIPLMLASGLSVLRADRLRPAPAFALAFSGVVFFGTHNITMLWGSTLMILIGGIALICIPETRQWMKRRSVLRVAILIVPAALVSAWFLVPALVYESHTLISHEKHHWEVLMGEFIFLVADRNLFTLSRAPAIAVGTDFALSLPVLAMAWSLASVLICLRRRETLRSAWVRLLLICAVSIVVLVVMMTHNELILALPRPYVFLQFTYRLESYIILLVCAIVIAGLAITQHAGSRRGRWRWAMIPVAIVAVVGAIQQTDAYPRGGGSRSVGIGPYPPTRTLLGLGDYLDANLPSRVDTYGEPPRVFFPLADIRNDRISKVVHLQPHQWVYSNIGGGPEFVHVSGAKIIGRESGGNDVLEIGPSLAGSKPKAARSKAPPTEVISVSAASGFPIVLGRVLSLIGLACLAGVFGVLAGRRLLSRGSARDAG